MKRPGRHVYLIHFLVNDCRNHIAVMNYIFIHAAHCMGGCGCRVSMAAAAAAAGGGGRRRRRQHRPAGAGRRARPGPPPGQFRRCPDRRICAPGPAGSIPAAPPTFSAVNWARVYLVPTTDAPADSGTAGARNAAGLRSAKGVPILLGVPFTSQGISAGHTYCARIMAALYQSLADKARRRRPLKGVGGNGLYCR